VPQAMTVISEAQIEDQQLRSIADVLYLRSRRDAGHGRGNRDQFTLRGNNTTADMFVDGFATTSNISATSTMFERVEVLRGPNAMIFGRGGGGGIVNRVTKRSSLTQFQDFSLSGDSWGGVRLTADVDQPIASGRRLRVNGMYENGESFRRHVDLERWGVNPTLGFLLAGRARDSTSARASPRPPDDRPRNSVAWTASR
jgi:catecholate siderophore receptor